MKYTLPNEDNNQGGSNFYLTDDFKSSNDTEVRG